MKLENISYLPAADFKLPLPSPQQREDRSVPFELCGTTTAAASAAASSTIPTTGSACPSSRGSTSSDSSSITKLISIRNLSQARRVLPELTKLADLDVTTLTVSLYEQPQQQYYQEPVARQPQHQQQQAYYQHQQPQRYPDQEVPYHQQQHFQPPQQQQQQPHYHYEQVEPGSPYFHQHQYRQHPQQQQRFDEVPDYFYQEHQQQHQYNMPIKAQPPPPAAKPLQQANRPSEAPKPAQFTQNPASVNVKGEQGTAKPGAPVFQGKFQNVTMKEGDSVKLYCKAVGDVKNMVWLHDGQKIADNDTYKIETKGTESTLHINNAKMADGGWYQCDAINDKGSASLKGRVVVQARKKQESEQLERVVLRKVDRTRPLGQQYLQKQQFQQQQPQSKAPPTFAGQLKSQNANQGQNVILQAQVNPADDPNLKIAWLHNGKALLNSSRVTTTVENGVAILEINNVNVNDSGTYTAVAVNTLGEGRSACELQVTGIGSHLLVWRTTTETAFSDSSDPRGQTQLPQRS
ncbi:hypothetical protein L596_021953 [Steinernema carpocapsae]|uniref:Ig-like domain-containing protein n=1 Tax=Steinernema carpocapsae TaxID=34508 RepID=A0A4U5MKC9_STECR|nr:hypothetical protein L596_021953 [Steinernema carpocapsae]